MAGKLRDHERARVAAFVEAVRRGEFNILRAAQACGASYTTMYRYCRKAGITSDGREESSLSSAQQERAQLLKGAGLSERRIADEIGCGRTPCVTQFAMARGALDEGASGPGASPGGTPFLFTFLWPFLWLTGRPVLKQ